MSRPTMFLQAILEITGLTERRRTEGPLISLGRTLAAAAACAVFGGTAGANPSVEFTGADLISPTAADAFYGASTTHSLSWTAFQRAKEVKALATGLGAGNVSNADYAEAVFEYVRKNIRTEFRFGLSKGALGALLDQSGTPFDQTELMVELLREAGLTASYEQGTITLTADQFGKWTGLVTGLNEANQTFSVNKAGACRLLADGGIPAIVAGSTSASCSYTGNLSGGETVVLSHVWVSHGGKRYDPSYKENYLRAGADVAATIGCGTDAAPTCGTQIMSVFGSTGSYGGIPSKTNINATGIYAQLSTLGGNLASSILANHQDKSVEQLLGGPELAPETVVPVVGTSFAYPHSTARTWSGDIPDQYRVSATVAYAGVLTKQLFLDEVYAERIRINPSDSEELAAAAPYGTPKLFVGRTLVTTGTQVTYNTVASKTLTMTLAFPYAASGGAYLDEAHTFKARSADPNGQYGGNGFPVYVFNPIAVVFQSGLASRGYEGRQSTALTAENTLAHAAIVGGGALINDGRELAQSLAKWHAENSQMIALVERLGKVRITHHATVGFQEDINAGAGGFTPISASSRFSMAHATNSAVDLTRAKFGVSLAMNALEGGASRRQYNTPDATSMVSLFHHANRSQPPTSLSGIHFTPHTFLHITNATQLNQLSSSYLPDRKTYLQNLLTAGYQLIAPQEGRTGRFWSPFSIEWNLIPVYAFNPSTGDTSLLYLQSGGELFAYKGGGTGTDDSVDPLEAALASTEQMEKPAATYPQHTVSLSTGALQMQPPPDLTVGSGEFPYSLGFSRTYDSTSTSTGFGQHYYQSCLLTPPNLVDCERHYSRVLGWRHNFEITASLTSDAYQGLGADSALDAAAAIVALKTVLTLNPSNAAFGERLAAVFVANWFDDQLHENAVAVEGGGYAGTYVKRPGTASSPAFNPPNGVNASLSQIGSKVVHNYQVYKYNYAPIQFDLAGGAGDVLEFRNNIDAEFQTKAMTQWTFPFGVDVDVEWSGNTVTRVSNTLGHELLLNYQQSPASWNGIQTLIPSLRSVSDNQGRQVKFAYQLIGQSISDYSCCPPEPQTYVLIFHNLFTMTSVEDPLGAVIKYGYTPGAGGGLHDGFDIFLNKLYKATNHTTPYVTIDYGLTGRVKKTTDILSQITKYAAGTTDETRYRRGKRITPSGAVTTLFTNDDGASLAEIDATGNKTTMTYDGIGRATSTVRPGGQQTVYTYDAEHNVVEERMIGAGSPALPDIVTRSAYDLASATTNLLWSEDAKGQRTDFTYFSNGRLKDVLQPAVNSVRPTTSYVYDARGLVTSVTDPTGVKSCFTYDSTKRYALLSATASCQPGGLNLTTTLTANLIGDYLTVNGPRTDVTDVSTFVYDARRRPIEAIGQLGKRSKVILTPDGLVRRIERDTGVPADPIAVTTFNYDFLGRVKSSVDPDGRTTATAYDGDSRVTVVTDPDLRKTRTVYDAANRPIKVIKSWQGLSNGTGGTINCTAAGTLQQCYQEMTYTVNGNLITLKDANGNLTQYNYDAHDRLKFTYFPSKTAPGTFSPTDYEQLTYDLNSNVLTKRARSGQTITFVYDALDRLTQRVVPGSSTSAAGDEFNYTYDLAGRKLTAAHAGATQTYAYDVAGRLLSQTITGPATMATGYEYDAAGNVTKLTYPDGYYVSHVYDALGRPTRTCEQTSSASCTTAAISGATPLLARVSYDALSRRASVNFRNGTAAGYAYTRRGDLTDLDWTQPVTPPLNPVFAGYDFVYAASGQLLREQVSDPLLAFAAGASGSDAYVKNGLNQYESVDGVTLTYDANGNMTKRPDGKAFEYDAANMLRKFRASPGGTAIAEYLYYADGQRRLKTGAGLTTGRFYYDGDQEIYETGSVSTDRKRRYVRLPGSVDEPFLMVDYTADAGCTTAANGAASCERWAHQNRLGSVVAVTSSAGAVLERFTYGPYGELGSQPCSGFPFRYTGQKLDPETCAYYYKARYYDPAIGRFLQTDPIGYADQMNLYGYVGNDPGNAIDPSGFDTVTCKSRGDELTCYIRRNDRPDSVTLNGEKILEDDHDNNIGNSDWAQILRGFARNAGFSTLTVKERRFSDREIDLAIEVAGQVPGVVPRVVARGAAAARRGRCCFVAGTLVQTKNGSIPIEQVKVGDLVRSWNEQTGETEFKPVIELIIRKDRIIWEVTVRDTRDQQVALRTTNDHPWWVTGQGWKNTEELVEGMAISTGDGRGVTVGGVQETATVELTYNIEVADFHTYFVGEAGVLVHNACDDRGGRRGMRDGVRPNRQQNRQAADARQQAERNVGQRMTRQQQREFHDRISGQDLSYNELVQEAEAVLRN